MKKIMSSFFFFVLITVAGCVNHSMIITNPMDQAFRINETNQPRHWVAECFPLTIYVPNHYSQEIKDSVHESVEWWNRSMARTVFSVVELDLVKILFLEPQDTICSSPMFISDISSLRERSSRNYVGLYNAQTVPGNPEIVAFGIIELYKNANPELITRILIHELGHMLNLRHDYDESSIMYPSISVGSPRRTLEFEDNLYIHMQMNGDPKLSRLRLSENLTSHE